MYNVGARQIRNDVLIAEVILWTMDFRLFTPNNH
jgi:hypothetical protein